MSTPAWVAMLYTVPIACCLGHSMVHRVCDMADLGERSCSSAARGAIARVICTPSRSLTRPAEREGAPRTLPIRALKTPTALRIVRSSGFIFLERNSGVGVPQICTTLDSVGKACRNQSCAAQRQPVHRRAFLAGRMLTPTGFRMSSKARR